MQSLICIALILHCFELWSVNRCICSSIKRIYTQVQSNHASSQLQQYQTTMVIFAYRKVYWFNHPKSMHCSYKSLKM